MEIKLNTIYNIDCFEGLKFIEDKSIDMILTDPPYNKIQSSWEYDLDLTLFWKEIKRIIKPSGAIVLTCAQPFTSKLVSSNLSMFRYELVWVKNRGTDFLNVNKKPLQAHENILVFYKKLCTYNPQKTQKNPYVKKSAKKESSDHHNPIKRTPIINRDGKRFPLSILYFNKVERGIHPTQKPLGLFEWLIKTYTNKGDLVLDPFLGSGTTALACLRLQRNFIAFEREEKYCLLAEERIKPFRKEQKRLDKLILEEKTIGDYLLEN